MQKYTHNIQNPAPVQGAESRSVIFQTAFDGEQSFFRRAPRRAAYRIARFRRIARCNAGEHVLFEPFVNGAKFFRREGGKRFVLLDAVTNDLSRNRVRVAEGDPFFRKVIGNVGCGGISFPRRFDPERMLEAAGEGYSTAASSILSGSNFNFCSSAV